MSLYTHLWVRLIGSALENYVDDYLRRIDISSGRFLILMHLEVNASGMKPSEIATSLGVTQATITGLIDGLVQTNLATRKEHEKDRRACIVQLTDKGGLFIREHRPLFNKHIAQVYELLSQEDQDQLIQLCEKLFQKLKPTHLSDLKKITEPC